MTTNATEKAEFETNSWTDDGICCYINDNITDDTNLFSFYRLYFPDDNGEYLYTTSQTEIDFDVANFDAVVQGVIGYVYESSVFSGIGTVPLYRLYLSSVKDHYFTINQTEEDYYVTTLGYTNETGATPNMVYSSEIPPPTISPTISPTTIPPTTIPTLAIAPSAPSLSTTQMDLNNGFAEIFSPTFIEGDITVPRNATLEISINSYLNISGCFTLQGSLIINLEQIHFNHPQQYIAIEASCFDNNTLNNVIITNASSCQKFEQSSHLENGGLVILLTPMSTCNNETPIIVGVTLGIIGLFAVFVVIVLAIPSLRYKIQPFHRSQVVDKTVNV